MSCCGKTRAQLQESISTQNPKVAGGAAPQPAAAQSIYFRYFGKTGLTVRGPASSVVYRFVGDGAPIAVDPRDAAALARVPNLRAIR